MTAIVLLAHRTLELRCEKPELVLRQGRETPLSRVVAGAVETMLGEALPPAEADVRSLALVGVSCRGEQSTIDHVAARFQEMGPAGIDPILFAKANQFFPIYHTSRVLHSIGPVSTAFSSGRHAADGLYFGWRLLRGGHARHALALAYDLDDARGSDDAVVVTLNAILLGIAHTVPSHDRTELVHCRLGPHIPHGAKRDAALAAWRRSLAADGQGDEILARDMDRHLQELGDTEAVVARTCHFLPLGAGNIVSTVWRSASIGAAA